MLFYQNFVKIIIIFLKIFGLGGRLHIILKLKLKKIKNERSGEHDTTCTESFAGLKYMFGRFCLFEHNYQRILTLTAVRVDPWFMASSADQFYHIVGTGLVSKFKFSNSFTFRYDGLPLIWHCNLIFHTPLISKNIF